MRTPDASATFPKGSLGPGGGSNGVAGGFHCRGIWAMGNSNGNVRR